MPISRTTFAQFLVVFVICFAAAVGCQFLDEAYECEFGGHPDEAAHYVTGLMIRDYIAAGFPGSPLKYAEKYYDHYPKVALGNWPPGFYLIQSAWTLLFSPIRASVLLLMALLSAATATILFGALRRECGNVLAIIGALLFVCLPLVQRHTSMIMTEVPIALFSLCALLSFSRFLETEKVRHAVWFGIFASAAILTKGSGMFLALVPALAILFTRRFKILLRPAFWVPAVIVLVLCGPWTWMFRNKARAGWMEDSPSLNFTKQALVFYPSNLLASIGFGLALFAVLGLILSVRRSAKAESPAEGQSQWPVFAAGIISLLFFHSIIPAGLEDRHLVPAVPLVLAFAVLGIIAVGQLLGSKFNLKAAPAIVAVIAIAIFMFEVGAFPKKGYRGFAPIAVDLLNKAPDPKTVFLVSSDAQGEGMFIAEVAMHEKRMGHTVRRASKALASSTWSGGAYQPKFKDEQELLAYLKKESISYLVVDGSMPPHNYKEHHKLLKRTVDLFPGQFVQEGKYQVQRKGKWSEELWLYQLKQ